MSRTALQRGVSACALIVCCQSMTDPAPAMAQQALPTIDIGVARRAAVARTERSSTQAGPRTAAAAPSTGPSASGSAPLTAAQIWSPTLPNGGWALQKKYNIPDAAGSSIVYQDVDKRINILAAQDAVRYFPSIYISENRGATQGRMQTRTFESNERNIIYLDNIPLNSLIGRGSTGNSYGGLQTQFRVISPEEIERVDFITGPWSAQYDGRSMGGVLTYSSKMPDKLKFTAKETVAVVNYNRAGLERIFPRSVTDLTLGDRWGAFSWYINATYQTYQYAPTATAAIPNPNTAPLSPNEIVIWTRTGFPQRITGVGGMFDTDLVNTKLKLAYDFTPTLRLQHSVGMYTQDNDVYGETYFSNNNNRWYTWFGPITAGNPNGLQAAASYYGRHQANMLVNAMSLRQNTGGVFDFDITASHFYFTHNVWNNPTTNVGGNLGGFTATGRAQSDTGDYWATLDLKGILRPYGQGGAHEVSFGLYGDQAHVVGVTYPTMNWASGKSSVIGNVYTAIGKGTTRTQALWAQEVWRFYPGLKLTAGIRGEHWIASDGFNQTATQAPSGGYVTAVGTPVFQPYRAHTRFSPKGSLEWKPIDDWTITGSVGMANRFPVLSELYTLLTPQGFQQPVSPSPYLRPEVSLNKELTFRRDLKSGGYARLSLFHDDIRDYIINQLVQIPGALAPGSATTNLEYVRNTGVEIDLRKNNFLLDGLDVFANATFVNSHIIANKDFIPSGPRGCGFGVANVNSNQNCWQLTDVGKRVPGPPKWRWKFGFTWTPDDRWSFSGNVRWIDYVWQTTANNDVAWGFLGAAGAGGQRVFSVDAKTTYKYNDRFTFDFGVDNIGNYKTNMIPQRTFVGAVRYKFEDGQKGGNGIFFAGDEAGLPDVSNWIRPVALNLN